MKLKELCDSLEKELPLSNAEVFEPYTIPDGYPWKDKTTDDCNMYACLYGLAEPFLKESEYPNVLEIGTGWGISGLTWFRLLAGRGFLHSLDKGDFGQKDNFTASLALLYENCPDNTLFDVNKFDTQSMYTQQTPQRRPWIEPADVLFIDGDHGDWERPWALFSDLWRFWPLLKPGGLCICDDLHEQEDYPLGRFPWLPYTSRSYHSFWFHMKDQIEDSYIWKYPFVPSGKRPVGLLRKKL